MNWSVRLGEACVLGETVRPEDFVAQLDEWDLVGLVRDVFRNDRGDDNLPFVQRLAALAGPRFNAVHAFCVACKRGALAVAQWIHDQRPDTRRATCLSSAFHDACSRRRMPVVHWLLTLDGAEDIEMNMPFMTALRGHNIPLARFLVSLGHVDVHTQNDWAIETMTNRHAWDVCRWLLALDPACSTWPAKSLHKIRTLSWSPARQVWMRSCCRRGL
jgi:hypothetical protein